MINKCLVLTLILLSISCSSSNPNDVQLLNRKEIAFFDFINDIRNHYKNSSLATTDRQVFLIKQLVRSLDGKIIDLSEMPLQWSSVEESKMHQYWLFYTTAYLKDEMWADMALIENKNKPNTYKGRSGVKSIKIDARKVNLHGQKVWTYSLADSIPLCGEDMEMQKPCFSIMLTLTIPRKGNDEPTMEDMTLPRHIIINSIQEMPCSKDTRCMNIEALELQQN